MLCVVDPQIDLLIGGKASAVQGQQESLVKIGVEHGLMGWGALVQLERQHNGKVDFIVTAVGLQLLINLMDARCVIAFQVIDRDIVHLHQSLLHDSAGHDDIFAFLGFLHIGIGGLQVILADAVFAGYGIERLAVLNLI